MKRTKGQPTMFQSPKEKELSLLSQIDNFLKAQSPSMKTLSKKGKKMSLSTKKKFARTEKKSDKKFLKEVEGRAFQ